MGIVLIFLIYQVALQLAKSEVSKNIIEAMKLHIDVMKPDGQEIPNAISESETLVLN